MIKLFVNENSYRNDKFAYAKPLCKSTSLFKSDRPSLEDDLPEECPKSSSSSENIAKYGFGRSSVDRERLSRCSGHLNQHSFIRVHLKRYRKDEKNFFSSFY